MNRSKLSVIIPVYNQSVLVKRAMDSVPPEYQLIVVDDGSTDGTMKTMVDFQNAHPERDIHLLYNFENKGVATAVNRGLEIATGEYVVLLGSDDYFFPDALRRIVDMADGKDLVYFDLLINDGTVWGLSENNKRALCGSVKLMRREFIGNTRNQVDKVSGEDLYFYKDLLFKNPTELFTGVVAKQYNFPRIGSLTNIHLGTV